MTAAAAIGSGRGIPLFLDFFYKLRARGLKVSAHNWLALLDAIARGLHGSTLDGFYTVARCILVNDEGDYDGFDLAFAETFRGVVADLEHMVSQLDEWLRDPKQLMHLDPAMLEQLEQIGLEELRRQLLERLAEQKERHEGGNRWVGTGGTSPFGQGGMHPSGVRMGGRGGGRSALAVADARRFRELRKDLVIDTRQMGMALRRLRRLERKGGLEELDIDGTVDETARNCGDLEIVMRPPRKNDVRMLLLLDVGGSMDPHAELVSRLFSAAHQHGGFKELESYYFHNCVYSRVYEDAAFTKPVTIDSLLRRTDSNWYLVLVGDAWMHPGELMMTSSSFWSLEAAPSGLRCLAKLADHFPKSAWINPEPPRLWEAPTISEIRRLFEMVPLTLDGLGDLVENMRTPPRPVRRSQIAKILRDRE
ncbi:VWA domain containing CoxE-like protein [Enhygromyxa salina]|uniref:VWA domain containing CoxE-like protein n=1 Tax=Enhygromyxa salina TaxID=215803 RepID=A0A2S9YI24_9BACT|nr:VWA domain-containing protein [Enhygromyxa salina]PRQ04666.1 VWA domain containing CoxE-like protein [Enhygromyxa salina]